jgi:hypothetical protein
VTQAASGVPVAAGAAGGLAGLALAVEPALDDPALDDAALTAGRAGLAAEPAGRPPPQAAVTTLAAAAAAAATSACPRVLPVITPRL